MEKSENSTSNRSKTIRYVGTKRNVYLSGSKGSGYYTIDKVPIIRHWDLDWMKCADEVLRVENKSLSPEDNSQCGLMRLLVYGENQLLSSPSSSSPSSPSAPSSSSSSSSSSSFWAALCARSSISACCKASS